MNTTAAPAADTGAVSPAPVTMPGHRREVVMLLENNPYPMDVRVRSEAESLARAGHRVRVIAPRAPSQRRHDMLSGVAVERFWLPDTPSTPLGFVVEYAVANLQLQLRALRRLVAGAAVVHLHNPPDTLFPIAFVARALGRDVVFDHHDLAPELFAAKFGDGMLVRVMQMFERLTMRCATVVVATNESYRRVALNRGGRRATDVAVVRNGPRAGTLAAGAPVRPGRLADPHLVFLGSMESQDGVDDLPAVLEALRGRHGLRGVRLTLIGEGSRRAPLAEAFAQAGFEEAVRFTGQVPHAKVPELLGEADICIDPAPKTPLNDHSTMIKIAEYLAAGRPVVAHRLTETAYTAGDAVCFSEEASAGGLADAVAAVAGDEVLRGGLAAAARHRAPELVWEHSERELLGVYARLLGT